MRCGFWGSIPPKIKRSLDESQLSLFSAFSIFSYHSSLLPFQPTVCLPLSISSSHVSIFLPFSLGNPHKNNTNPLKNKSEKGEQKQTPDDRRRRKKKRSKTSTGERKMRDSSEIPRGFYSDGWTLTGFEMMERAWLWENETTEALPRYFYLTTDSKIKWRQLLSESASLSQSARRQGIQSYSRRMFEKSELYQLNFISSTPDYLRWRQHFDHQLHNVYKNAERTFEKQKQKTEYLDFFFFWELSILKLLQCRERTSFWWQI